MRTHEILPALKAVAFAITLALVAAALAAPAAPAHAQGWIEPLPDRPAPGVVRVRSDVDVRITGRVARVTVEEWFENRGGRVAEGVYVYPLPGEAVFSNFSLYQGDRELRGETMDADRARRIYEEIVRKRRDPALIELVGHGLIRARVFPIEAGQSRKITLRYTQVLERAGDAVQFRYAGVRPTAGAAATPVGLSLTADTDAYRDAFSPTHTLDVERRGGELRVRPTGTVQGDLTVFLPVAGSGVGISLATHRPAGEDGYFMLTLSPGDADAAGTPRDITAVVDVSGSMSGTKLAQTQAALRQLLGSLGPDDRFRLVAFSNRVRASDDGWTRATGPELEAARRWVDALEADGGTNIAGALEEALRLESPDDRLPIVVFLTDGLPTVGEQDPEAIADAADARRARHRVFAFGVGYDVNTYLLDRLSAAGRGSTEYVEPGEDVERVVSLLAGKITRPVLTDLVVASAPVDLVQLYPGELPDLFAGEELVLFGRYRGSGSGELRIRGRRAGRTETFGADVELAGHTGANDYIPRLWASRKLGELTQQVRLNGPDPELVEAIRTTALRYGLLSEYTAYLVQEPTMAGGGPVRLRAVAADAMQAPSGQVAVQAAERARAKRAVTSAADLARAEAEAAEAMAPATGSGVRAVRVVAGRTFRRDEPGAGRDEGAWIEVTPDDDDRPVREIALYSAAFFDLLAELPELRAVVTELQPVVVKGRAVALRFGDDGVTSLSEREVRRLVERFRTR
ncbi:MAG: VIT domain-containing protein [Candidatus Longimicrobiales bacterium M2_2A_002]